MRKVQALLFYLAAEPENAHRRDQLMTLFWPRMPESSARANLRQILFHLRQAIPEVVYEGKKVPRIVANRHTIRLNHQANIDIDTAQFDALLDRVHSHDHLQLLNCHACYQTLQQAVSLYKGSFLADFYLDDSNAFEEWAETHRQQYRRKMLDALGTLTTIAMRRSDFAEALVYAEQQFDIDNLHESGYRQLMKVLALSGQRAAALSLYDRYRRLLDEELGMAPTAQTTRLAEQIQLGEVQFDQPQIPAVRGYEMKEEIGAGTYGVIHRAVQPAIGREVAVKIIRRRYASDPAFIRRFEAEAQTIARVEHPHIVPLYDYWREPDGAFLVMRLMRGGNLLTKLQGGPWTPEQTCRFLDQIAPALLASHEQGIIHRDIKPANILFDEAENAYLSDFGVAMDLFQVQELTAAGDTVATLDYTSPEQLQAGPVTPQSDIYSLGAVLYEMLTGEKPLAELALANLVERKLNGPFPLLSESQPGLPPGLDVVIQQATARRPEDRFPTVLALAEMFGHFINNHLAPVTTGRAPVAGDVPNPYKGLRAYQEADAQDFFGRETLTGQLTERLSHSRFLAVVGPSGSGKSSLVKAGLIPALRQGALPGSDRWYIAQMVPGDHPLEELELALWPIAVDPPPSLVEPMQKDSRGLLRTLRRVLPNEENVKLLLVIDQFEELFAMVDDEARRNHFLESLYVAITAPRTPLRVVVTLRADFYDRPLQYQPLANLFKQHTDLVLPLERDELTWAIQEPARRVGVTFEDGLLPAIVADVDAQPGSLPLLQYALTELFERRRHRKITRQAYAAIGGVPGALARRADELFNTLTLEQQAAAHQLFLRLVTLGEGDGDTAVSPDTRRRVKLSEVHQISAEVTAVLDQFGDARLLTFDRDPLTREPTVEVAHEALLSRWERLQMWLKEGREDIRLQRQLARAEADWQANDEDESYLMRGAMLNQFEALRQRNSVALLPQEEAYLQASLEARQARQAAEAERQQRELETAQQLAASEARRAREQTQAADQLRRRALLLASALVVAGILAVVAVIFGNQSRREAQIALSRELAAAALTNLAEDRERSILLSLEALSSAHTLQAEEVLHEAITTSRLRRTFELDSEGWGLAYSPDGRYIATGEISGQIIIWEVDTGDVHLTLGPHEGSYVNDLDFNSDGSLLASAGDFDTRLWDVATGEELLRMDAHRPDFDEDAENWIIGVDFSPDDKLLATSSWNSTAILWDVDASLAAGSGEIMHILTGHTNPLWQINFSRDVSRVATASHDGTAKIWDVASGEELLTLQVADAQEELGIESVVFTRDGAQVVVVGGTTGSAEMSVWDASTGERLYEFYGHNAFLQNVKLSPTGSLMATGGGDTTAKVWDLSGVTPRALFTLYGHTDWVNDLAFSPDEKYLATISRDGTAKLWDISPTGSEELLTLDSQNDNLNAIAYSPDGTLLAASGNDTTSTTIWDIATAQPVTTLNHDDVVNYIEFSPDGAVLAAANDDSTVRLWEVGSGQEVRLLEGHKDVSEDKHYNGIAELDFSPDGDRLATAGEDGLVKIWNIETGTELHSLSGHPEGNAILAVDFSDDGDLLAAGTNQPSIITIWDSSTGEKLMELPGYEANRIFQVAFSPDGTLLAVGTNGHQLEVWQLPEVIGARGQEEAEILFSISALHSDRALSFNSSGTQILTAGQIWDATTGERLLTLRNPDGVGDAAFSPDDTRVATAGRDGLVRVFTLDLEELIALAQSRVTRSLTRAECQQYLHVDECPDGE